jgi:hypothetical protein
VLATKIEPGNKVAGARTEARHVARRSAEPGRDGGAHGEGIQSAGALEQFRKALALDSEAPRAADGIARIEARFANDAFASTMARGYAALAKAGLLRCALGIRGGASRSSERSRDSAGAEADRAGAAHGVISAKLQVAQEHEAAERWADALKEYRAGDRARLDGRRGAGRNRESLRRALRSTSSWSCI